MRGNNMKKFIILFLAIALLGLAAACVDTKNDSSFPVKTATHKTEYSVQDALGENNLNNEATYVNDRNDDINITEEINSDDVSEFDKLEQTQDYEDETPPLIETISNEKLSESGNYGRENIEGDNNYPDYYQDDFIHIESIEIYNAETNMPLEKEITVTRNTVLYLKAVIMPENATVKEARLNLASSEQNFGRFAKIDADGKLTINDKAPFGAELYLSATANPKSSGAYKITITQIPVETVQLIPEKNYLVKNSILNLNAYIYPENADVIYTQFKIINAPTGVHLSGNLLFASNDAIAGSEIQVIAIVNGIESEVVTIRVVDNIPPEG